jgi:hypothetical protein
MIPRHQTILFLVLLLASVIMSVVLWQLRDRAHQRMLVGQDSAPTQAPEVAPVVQATLLVANDTDNSLLAQVQSLPLPEDPGTRARIVLGKLLELYAAPDATHPVPGGATSIAQVFLLPVVNQDLNSAGGSAALDTGKFPLARAKAGDSSPAMSISEEKTLRSNGPQLAVVNLTGAFAANHPSSLETETLTVLSICGTLHANLPRVTQVRFLVDGAPRATLAGHADLTRTYLATEAVPTDEANR